MYINNEWGTVCDDGWSTADARVVCQQLGHGSPIATPWIARFPQGSGRIWLDDVSCSGRETSLAFCSHSGIGLHNCDHSEDVSVKCNAGEHIFADLLDDKGIIKIVVTFVIIRGSRWPKSKFQRVV